LLLIRDGKANSWEALCRELDLDPNHFATGQSIVLSILQELKEAGLIEFETQDKVRPWEPPRIKDIQVSPAWERIQQALRVSLTQLADFDPRHGLVVRPFFGRPDDATRKYDVFVLMPFTDSMRPVYDDHIKKVASELSLSIPRADDFFSAHSVMADVWSAIFSAKAIIADCTARNPNVFYEIGLAHVLGKPVILITQKSEDVPFDVRHLRYLEYTFTPRGMVDFERALGETLRNVLNVG